MYNYESFHKALADDFGRATHISGLLKDVPMVPDEKDFEKAFNENIEVMGQKIDRG